jgi:hypothetical protein
VNPRKAPKNTGVHSKVTDELVRYGTPQDLKPNIGAALATWYDAGEFGLPPGLSHVAIISDRRGGQNADWRLYLEIKAGIRIAIAERLDGEDLLLLLLVPAKLMSEAEALNEARNRL